MAGPPRRPGSSQHAAYPDSHHDEPSGERSGERELSPFTLAQMLSDPNNSLLASMSQAGAAAPGDALFWPPPSDMPQTHSGAVQQSAMLASTSTAHDDAALNELLMGSGLYPMPAQTPHDNPTFEPQQPSPLPEPLQLNASAASSSMMRSAIAPLPTRRTSVSGPSSLVASPPAARAESGLPSSSAEPLASTDDGKPSRRAILACRFCRSRKLRCDGEEPCRQCARRGETCEYTLPPAAKRRAQQRTVDASTTNSSAVTSADEASASQSSKRHDSGATKGKTSSRKSLRSGISDDGGAPSSLPAVAVPPADASVAAPLSMRPSSFDQIPQEVPAARRRRSSGAGGQDMAPLERRAEESSSATATVNTPSPLVLGPTSLLQPAEASPGGRMPILEDVGALSRTPPDSPARPHAGHLSDILGDMGALADALDVMTLGAAVEADAPQSADASMEEAEEALEQRAAGETAPQPMRMSGAAWWDELLGVFQAHGSRSRAAATSALRTSLWQFCSGSISLVYLVHPPTLMGNLLSEERRRCVYPALYFAIASVGCLVDPEHEGWFEVTPAISASQRALSRALADAAHAHLHTSGIADLARGLEALQATSALALLEERGSARQMAMLRFLVGLLYALQLPQKVAASTDMAEHLPVPPPHPAFAHIAPPRPGLTLEAEVQREVAVRLCWAPTNHGVRVLDGQPDGRFVCSDTRLVPPSTSWSPSLLYAHRAALPESYFSSRFQVRVGVAVMRLAQKLARPDAQMPHLRFAFDAEADSSAQPVHAAVLEELESYELYLEAITAPYLADIRLKDGRSMIEAMCLVGVRVRLECHRVLGTFHASTSRPAQQLPATIAAWLQSWTFRLREIDAARLALLHRTIPDDGGGVPTADAQKLDSWVRLLRLGSDVYAASGHHRDFVPYLEDLSTALEAHAAARAQLSAELDPHADRRSDDAARDAEHILRTVRTQLAAAAERTGP